MPEAPVDPSDVVAAVHDQGRWHLRSLAETGSTNADLAAAAAHHDHGTVLITDLQNAGRGRLGRTWTAPPGTSLLVSVLLKLPQVPAARRGWIGAILGLALVDGIEATTDLRAGLKWPNDVLIDGRKCAGILAELAGDALVVGAGVNVTLSKDQLPRVDATSLLLEGAEPDRSRLLAATLNAFGPLLDQWAAADGDVQRAGILDAYRRACVSLGAAVRVELPDGSAITGTARDVTPDGSLQVRTAVGDIRTFSAGDVQHLRPAGPESGETG